MTRTGSERSVGSRSTVVFTWSTDVIVVWIDRALTEMPLGATVEGAS
jgi:hypothetical protein